jgi:hypothetical protein
MNKRGQEKYLSGWNIFVWIVVGVFVVVAIAMFNSAETDVRFKEAKILADKVVDCFIEDGRIVEEVLMDDFDYFVMCNLDDEAFGENGDFYVEVKINNIILGETIKNHNFGNGEIKLECLQGSAKCYRGDVEVKGMMLKVLTASRNVGREVT